MIWKRKNISKALFSLFILFLLIFIVSLIYQVQETRIAFFAEIPLCLQTSIRQTIEHKAKDAYYFAPAYEYNPNKNRIGEYEIRTARYADTTFTYRSKIVDPGTDAFRGYQTGFLETGQLHADSIHILFDSLLQEKNIYVESILGITASFHTKKNEWSGDTTAIDINYRTVFANQGDYEDINYYAYIHYSPYTLWTLMHKVAIGILFICTIFMAIVLLWWLHKRKKEKKNEIVLLKNGNYRIRDIKFNVAEKTLIIEEAQKEIILSQNLNDLLLMFLETKHYRVSKEDIKQKFWPKSITALTNMTSTVNRLNKVLKDIQCPYTIATDLKNDEYYIFSVLPPSSPELR